MTLMSEALTLIRNGAAETVRREPARQLGEADNQFLTRLEDRAQRIFYPALAEFKSKIQDAMALSDIQREQFQYLLDAIHDNAPVARDWDEKIAAQ